MIRETEYAAAPFCGVDMPSRSLTGSINGPHLEYQSPLDMTCFKECHKPAGNSRRLERERCWRGYLSGVGCSDLHIVQLMPLLHHPVISCYVKIKQNIAIRYSFLRLVV